MELQDICSYVKTKVETSNYSIEDYISTENMLPEKGGITVASSFPSGKVTEFQENDILISNIRPYFKRYGRQTEGDVVVMMSYVLELIIR